MQRYVISLDKYTSVGPDNTYTNKSIIVIIKMIGTEVPRHLTWSRALKQLRIIILPLLQNSKAGQMRSEEITELDCLPPIRTTCNVYYYFKTQKQIPENYEVFAGESYGLIRKSESGNSNLHIYLGLFPVPFLHTTITSFEIGFYICVKNLQIFVF